MKILLMGDYSSLHFNLYKGLKYLNHDVDLASTGDGRGIYNTHNLNPPKSYNNRIINGALRLKIEFDLVNSLGNYDVIQIINPHVLSNYHPFNLYSILRKKAKKLILISAGIDKTYLNNREKHFDYYFDFNVKESKLSSKIEDHLLSIVDGVITTSYTYKKVYEGNSKFIDNIGFPIIVESEIKFLENKRNFNFFVGKFQTKIQNFDTFVSVHDTEATDGQPIEKSVKTILEFINKKVDCVVDQTYAYDPGINALISMAKGKIVFGGCETAIETV